MSLISPLFFGLLTATGAVVTELFVFSFFIQDGVTQMSFTANDNFVFATGGIGFLFFSAVIEECFKYSLLKKTLLPNSSVRKTIFSLFFFAIGFSGLEIMFLVFDNSILDTTIILSIIGIFLIHLTTVSLFGSMLSRQSSRRYALLSLPLAILIHFVYNVIILYQSTLHI